MNTIRAVFNKIHSKLLAQLDGQFSLKKESKLTNALSVMRKHAVFTPPIGYNCPEHHVMVSFAPATRLTRKVGPLVKLYGTGHLDSVMILLYMAIKF